MKLSISKPYSNHNMKKAINQLVISKSRAIKTTQKTAGKKLTRYEEFTKAVKKWNYEDAMVFSGYDYSTNKEFPDCCGFYTFSDVSVNSLISLLFYLSLRSLDSAKYYKLFKSLDLDYIEQSLCVNTIFILNEKQILEFKKYLDLLEAPISQNTNPNTKHILYTYIIDNGYILERNQIETFLSLLPLSTFNAIIKELSRK